MLNFPSRSFSRFTPPIGHQRIFSLHRLRSRSRPALPHVPCSPPDVYEIRLESPRAPADLLTKISPENVNVRGILIHPPTSSTDVRNPDLLRALAKIDKTPPPRPPSRLRAKTAHRRPAAGSLAHPSGKPSRGLNQTLEEGGGDCIGARTRTPRNLGCGRSRKYAHCGLGMQRDSQPILPRFEADSEHFRSSVLKCSWPYSEQVPIPAINNPVRPHRRPGPEDVGAVREVVFSSFRELFSRRTLAPRGGNVCTCVRARCGWHDTQCNKGRLAAGHARKGARLTLGVEVLCRTLP
mmetsp:Transcript_8677/g.25281  ORF Transcript_8677/g.25281 Transcript_8677/m.25281 type:complete len:294 (+) Transcript_8677:266-1147(+)